MTASGKPKKSKINKHSKRKQLMKRKLNINKKGSSKGSDDDEGNRKGDASDKLNENLFASNLGETALLDYLNCDKTPTLTKKQFNEKLKNSNQKMDLPNVGNAKLNRLDLKLLKNQKLPEIKGIKRKNPEIEDYQENHIGMKQRHKKINMALKSTSIMRQSAPIDLQHLISTKQKDSKMVRTEKKMLRHPKKEHLLKEAKENQRRDLTKNITRKGDTKVDVKNDIWSSRRFTDKDGSYVKHSFVTQERLTHKAPAKRPFPRFKPNLLPAVPIPLPGQSYNPSLKDHQELVELSREEIKKSAMKEAKERRRLKTAMKTLNVPKISAEEAAKEMMAGIGSDQEDAEEEPENEKKLEEIKSDDSGDEISEEYDSDEKEDYIEIMTEVKDDEFNEEDEGINDMDVKDDEEQKEESNLEAPSKKKSKTKVSLNTPKSKTKGGSKSKVGKKNSKKRNKLVQNDQSTEKEEEEKPSLETLKSDPLNGAAMSKRALRKAKRARKAKINEEAKKKCVSMLGDDELPFVRAPQRKSVTERRYEEERKRLDRQVKKRQKVLQEEANIGKLPSILNQIERQSQNQEKMEEKAEQMMKEQRYKTKSLSNNKFKEPPVKIATAEMLADSMRSIGTLGMAPLQDFYVNLVRTNKIDGRVSNAKLQKLRVPIHTKKSELQKAQFIQSMLK